MKTDTYTKIILTIIASCLTINIIKQWDFIPTVHATENMETPELSTKYKLVPISDNDVLDVRIVDINTYDELNVNLKNVDTYDMLKVNISKIETSDEMDVNIDEVGGSFVSSGGPIKVKVE